MQFWQVAIPRTKPDQLDYLQIYKKWVENPGKRDEMLPEVKPETASARPYKQTHATLIVKLPAPCYLLPRKKSPQHPESGRRNNQSGQGRF